jgi:putative peptidoglycan lipid II flippase
MNYQGFATVGGMTIVSRILGLVRDVLIAAVLGTSYVADALFVAFRVPNMFRRLFSDGSFDAAFIPLFAKRLQGEGPEKARAFAGEALSCLTFLLVGFTLLAEIAMPWFMLLLAPGFTANPEKFALAVTLARIVLPYLVFLSLVALYSGILNAFGRYAVAAFAPTMLNVVLIAVLLALTVLHPGSQHAAGEALAWGIVASGVLQVLIVAFAAAKIGMCLPFRRPRFTPDMRRLATLAAPGVLAGALAQFALVISTIIATMQDGVVSWLYYADRLIQLPLGVIGVTIGVVLLPELSHKLRSGDHEAAAASENRAIEFALLLAMPATVFLFLAAEPIMRVLFERGAFTSSDTNAASKMLAALALGVPAYVLIKVLQSSYFAREDTKTPMIFAAVSMTSNLVLSFALLFAMGPTGIAIATMLSGWLNVALLLSNLRRRQILRPDQIFRRRLTGILVAGATMAVAVIVLVGSFGLWFEPSRGIVVQVTALTILMLTGLFVYIGIAYLLSAAHFRELIKAAGF